MQRKVQPCQGQMQHILLQCPGRSLSLLLTLHPLTVGGGDCSPTLTLSNRTTLLSSPLCGYRTSSIILVVSWSISWKCTDMKCPRYFRCTKRLLTGHSSEKRTSGTLSSRWKTRTRQLHQPALLGAYCPHQIQRESRDTGSRRYYHRRDKTSSLCRCWADCTACGRQTPNHNSNDQGEKGLLVTSNLGMGISVRGHPQGCSRDFSGISLLSHHNVHITPRPKSMVKQED